MSWAEQRRHVIEAILIACGITVVALVCVAVFYKTPSCTDAKQNQGEQGVDCGGPCPYACSFQETPLVVRFVNAVSPQPGRVDLIAYVDNANSNAQVQNANYTAQFFDTNGKLLAQKTGMISVPPSTTMPLFIPDFYLGSTPVSQAFLTIDATSYKWFRTSNKPVVPIPGNIQTQNTTQPKITATLSNPLAVPMTNVTVVATVFNAENNAIAASQTVAQTIPPQSSVGVVFTWNEPFTSAPSRVEILPSAPASL